MTLPLLAEMVMVAPLLSVRGVGVGVRVAVGLGVGVLVLVGVGVAVGHKVLRETEDDLP